MLFGHQSDDNSDTSQPATTVAMNNAVVTAPSAPANPLAVDAATGVSLPTVPEEALEKEVPAAAPTRQLLGSAPEPEEAEALESSPAVVAPGSHADAAEEAAAPAPTPDADELLSLKQQALEQLGPLVNHLEQSPEEKFRTTMMMIQSADNQSLIKEAYAAAQAITDDKVRAQALLDIVNEINYFTQQSQNS